ncbi:L,D-transpeptidase family protein [Promicromonospora sp. Populi]|uniref:L,D-transpeptidase family protein n=1 Tax=Promicromonospora sp. Populi TaxID=3239420 RepID=UPI0034E2DECD
MRVVQGRSIQGANGVVGKRVMGTLGALALTASLLSACGGDQEPPAEADTTTTSPTATPTPTPTPEEPEASPEPSASESQPEEPEASPSPSDGTDEGSEEGSGDDEGAEEPEEPEVPDYIQYGEVSDRVGALQQRLQDLGYFITSVDNTYGGETQQAVFALQKAGGLYRDGVVGDQTQAAADDGVVPQAETSSGKVLEIDIDRQLVLAVENGRVVRVINASSGNGETYEALGNTYRANTPRGSFAVYRSEDRMYESGLELGEMWRPKFFTGGIAVHGSASVPAFPASHGCVRVSNGAMDWIWDTWGAPAGTPVVVY